MLPLLALLCAATPSAVDLPGAPNKVSMDYLAVEAQPLRVWLPAGNTGNVDVLDARTLKVTPIAGFPTASVTTHHGARVVGPSSVTLGERMAFIGDRADRSLCAVNRSTLSRAGCAQLADMPDGIAYVPSTHEVWITTPHTRSLTIVDVRDEAKPRVAGVMQLSDVPEGIAVDRARGRVFTSLRDADQTLAIDAASRKELARVSPACGSDGPGGDAWSAADQVLFVACDASVSALSWGTKPALVARAVASSGLDNIDCADTRHLVFAAGGKDATLTILRFTGHALEVVSTVSTSAGVRAVVAAPDGTAYAADPGLGRVLVIPAPALQR